MGAQTESRALGMSDLEQAVKTRDVSMACYIASEGNFGIGDVERLQMAVRQLESMKTLQMEERHVEEIEAGVSRINDVVRYLRS